MVIPREVKKDMTRTDRQPLIDAGTDFWCISCFYTLPVRYRSEDGEHCIDCFEVIHEMPGTADDQPANAPEHRLYTARAEKRGRGRPRKALSTDRILHSSKSQQQLAEEAGVSQSTISRRIKAAQGVLI